MDIKKINKIKKQINKHNLNIPKYEIMKNRAKKLYSKNELFSFRISKYRIIFKVINNIIYIIDFGNRDKIYNKIH